MTGDEILIDDMKEVRAYCALIHRARINAGFNSVKYPVTDVKVNRVFFKDERQLIADECNITGYMSIPPVEYLDPLELYTDYQEEKDEYGRIVLVSTTRSDWQQKLFDKRLEKRKLADLKKQNEK